MLVEVFDTLSTVVDWIISSVQSVLPMFWDTAQNQLTFLGMLALCGLGISVSFLLIGIIQNFLHFRG